MVKSSSKGVWLPSIFTLIMEEPSADYHMYDIRCQSLQSLGPLSPKTKLNGLVQ